MIGRLGFHPKAVDEPTMHDYQLALANYRLNTLDAIKYSTSRGIKFVIVQLSIPADSTIAIILKGKSMSFNFWLSQKS